MEVKRARRQMKSSLPSSQRNGIYSGKSKFAVFDDRCEIPADVIRERLRNYRPTPDDAVAEYGLYQRGGRS